MSTSHPILIADVLRLRTFAHVSLIALVSVGLAACAGPNQKRPADDALGATPTSVATSASGAHDFDFDPKTHEWSIWWLDGRAPVSPIDPPVVGHFGNGIGLFYAAGDVNGKPTRTRFTWTHASASEARWEQALSTDGGKTWTTNWTMAFHRIAQSDRTPDARPADRP